jgi:hypothetical protein
LFIALTRQRTSTDLRRLLMIAARQVSPPIPKMPE